MTTKTISIISKILTKQVQNKVGVYFFKFSNYTAKPENRCIREMTTGTVLVNKIASGINDYISLIQNTKRFCKHNNKLGFFKKLFRGYMESIKGKIHRGDYILFDVSDIQKKYVKDGDKGGIGLGYWLMGVVHFGKD